MATSMPISIPSFCAVDCERETGDDVWLEVEVGVCRDVVVVEDILAAGVREVGFRRLEAVSVAGNIVRAGLEGTRHDEESDKSSKAIICQFLIHDARVCSKHCSSVRFGGRAVNSVGRAIERVHANCSICG